MIQPQLGLVLVYAGHFDYRLEPYPGGTTAPGYLPRACPAGPLEQPPLTGPSTPAALQARCPRRQGSLAELAAGQ